MHLPRRCVIHIDYLLGRFAEYGSRDAIVWRDEAFSYGWCLEAVTRWRDVVEEQSIDPGTVVSLEADFSPNAVALLLALVDHGCIVVPLATAVGALKPEFRRIAEVETIAVVGEDDHTSFSRTGTISGDGILTGLKESEHPGLILFSSGSTGKNKASVHDFVPLLEKFKVERNAWRTITFLLFDHIGGVNTLFYTLSNGGCIVTVRDRSPDAVCKAIQQHEVELLPTSPTFINLLLISEAYKRCDLSSLQVVTYGTEPMPQSTLKRFCKLFPDIRLQQTYGLSEVGILRSKSKSSDSLWVKVGGEGFDTRVVDGMLEIKAESAMLGYLNAPNPFTEDGWFKTGDAVEVDGEYLRFLGRKQEIINVGGEKVYPVEVESVLQQMKGVEEVMVSGEDNAITGQLVKARVKLGTGESPKKFRKRMREFCGTRLAEFKIPQKVVFADEPLHGDRFKKIRKDVQV